MLLSILPLDSALAMSLFVPLVGTFFVLFSRSIVWVRNFALVSSVATLFLVFYLWIGFNKLDLAGVFYGSVFFDHVFGLRCWLGLDGISLSFLILTAFLMPICLLSIQGVVDREKEYTAALLILQLFMQLIFVVQNLLLFFIFFESVLIPMFFIIGVMGSRMRRIYASYMLVLYTLFGSVPMLFGVIYLYYKIGWVDYNRLVEHCEVLLSVETKRVLWLAFFMGFAVKVPMVPFHIWLPEAHAEAPTAGSVILAGILLKIGTYGFIRYSLALFPEASSYFAPFVYLLSVIAIVYTSLTTLRQIDLKKIVAYSSVAHMGYVTMGIFSGNATGLEGAILIMLSHGFVSSALFLCIGVIYDRYKTRIYKYYAGLAQFMPVFVVMFLVFSMANLGLPGTSSFAGEFMVVLGIIPVNIIVAGFALIGTILSAAYSLWLFNRVSFGVLKTNYLSVVRDVTLREFYFLVPLLAATIFFGVFPNTILEHIHMASHEAISEGMILPSDYKPALYLMPEMSFHLDYYNMFFELEIQQVQGIWKSSPPFRMMNFLDHHHFHRGGRTMADWVKIEYWNYDKWFNDQLTKFYDDTYNLTKRQHRYL